jgi:hypothetical protein
MTTIVSATRENGDAFPLFPARVGTALDIVRWAKGSQRETAMHALLLTWDLRSKDITVLAALREHITDEAWGHYKSADDLFQKVWLSSTDPLSFAAFSMWETPGALERELNRIGRLRDITGLEPKVDRWVLEAAQRGKRKLHDITVLGRAWE